MLSRSEVIHWKLQAYVNIPAQDEAIPPSKGAADRAVLDKLAIQVNPKLFAERIQFLEERSQIQKVLLKP